MIGSGNLRVWVGRWRARLMVAVPLLLLAFGLRMFQLDAQSLWNDEGSSYIQATRSFSQIAVHAAADIHPPGYYWLLRVWMSVTGESVLALRSLSVLASVLSVAALFALAVRLYPERRNYGILAGVVAGGLLALNTFAIYYAQEARMYALLGLWVILAAWAAAGLFQRPTWGAALLLGGINALGLWTQYAFPLYMLAQGFTALLWLVSLWRHKPRNLWRGIVRYVAANLLALALFAPLMMTALRQVTTWPNTGVNAPYSEALSVIMGWLAFGISYSATNTTWIAVMLILVLFGLNDLEQRVTRPDRRWRSLMALSHTVIPVGLFVYAGLFREGNVKFLLPAAAMFALAVGQGAAGLWWRISLYPERGHDDTTLRSSTVPRPDRTRPNLILLVRAVTILACVGIFWNVAVAVPALYTDTAYQRSNYRDLIASIALSLNPANDAIILNAPGQIDVFQYYYRGQPRPLLIPYGVNSTDNEIRQDTEFALENHDQLFVVLWGEAERDPRHVVETTLDADAFEVNNTWYGDVRLAHYVTRANWFEVVAEPNIRFGDAITLRRYKVSARSYAPGDVMQVELSWEANQALTTRYKVFVQLLDENGQLVAQHDAEPVGSTLPTTAWEPNTRILDNHALLIPRNALASPHYSLIIGLYDIADSTARLPVGGGNTATTFYEIAPFTVDILTGD
jgi:hypothetical protein